MLVADPPETRYVRITRHSFKHHRGGAVCKRSVDDIAVAGNPADIGRTPVDFSIVVIEYVLVSHRSVNEIATGCVQNPLGLSGRTRSIENEKRILSIHFLDRAVIGNFRGGLVIPDVPAPVPRHIRSCAAHYQDFLYNRVHRTVLKRVICIKLKRHLASATQTFVCCNDYFRRAVRNPPRKRVRRKTSEHDRMNGADTRARKHGEGSLGDHRHVYGYPVALAGAQRLKHVSHAADFAPEFRVSKLLVFTGIIPFPYNRDFIRGPLRVAVNAVCRHVKGSVVKPPDRYFPRTVACVLHLRIGPDPVNPLAVGTPESLRVLN